MIINLPGPPKEFNYVVEHSLKPYLEQFRQEQIYTQDFLVMGIGESMIDEKLTETQYKQTDVTTLITSTFIHYLMAITL